MPKRKKITKNKRIVKKRDCYFCKNGITIDYKEVYLLQRFTTERGKILPRRITGTCAKHQRPLAIAVKRARHLALLHFVKAITR